MTQATDCPCGSGKALSACCGPLIDGLAVAPTAEAMMRSRYVAFSQGNAEYLRATLATGHDDDFDPEEIRATAKNAHWQGLEIRKVTEGGADDDEGTVEFIARFKIGGRSVLHHERSHFLREDGQWRCADAEMNPTEPPRSVVKIGRNDPCPCGSGKKYKKCCGVAA
ncbi:YchJ family protein [Rhodospirillum rubrum]|uniref:SEC-C domain protein n=1 Tax=Rhodospirillum rubrum (strain ATCC 11170 / ATH 1.1.1 / DSM 467 / LMG 4362 / NCIMB 8255 / S1) TaxID=269796 RepID=Q2RSW3_RHORT|nr:YchJ family protein [Rhodospirillum rubrum]ABC22782.1 SEC-C domain protein [Rhodospirillum rubrum ATCC 11170]AEO48503.1 SEC-C domain-containing protein [Rhodospirillum rubrum F11]MBK5954379.1 hypothetical protein [Rhodospirillum rubrum]QXG78771.1 YchJ family protein [Rhodospirillum rubrum]HAQ01495.1 hypothetical protein [Rhodospirillum rubrum]